MCSVVACDLDGVVWLGRQAIPGAAGGIARLRAHGHRVVFVTNNSYATRAACASRLSGIGIPTTPDDIVTSATAAARWCAGVVPPTARLLVHGGPGVHEALRAAGFERLDDAGVPEPDPERHSLRDDSNSDDSRPGEGPHAAVVCGWHPEFDFERLTRATHALHLGARFVATNTDPTYPDQGRRLPGNGALVAALERASGRPPDVVAGKPHSPMVDAVRAICGSGGIMIGDRPSTDGAFAAALGWPFALVLTGVAGRGREEAIPEPAPRWVESSLGALAERMCEDRS